MEPLVLAGLCGLVHHAAERMADPIDVHQRALIAALGGGWGEPDVLPAGPPGTPSEESMAADARMRARLASEALLKETRRAAATLVAGAHDAGTRLVPLAETFTLYGEPGAEAALRAMLAQDPAPEIEALAHELKGAMADVPQEDRPARLTPICRRVFHARLEPFAPFWHRR